MVAASLFPGQRPAPDFSREKTCLKLSKNLSLTKVLPAAMQPFPFHQEDTPCAAKQLQGVNRGQTLDKKATGSSSIMRKVSLHQNRNIFQANKESNWDQLRLLRTQQSISHILNFNAFESF
ncbi:hypothetical protein AMECASPLE_015133 [Ameca splendens]|uniref:Uncharacterized protein n=1 Tax=Ameca splendens TaxID=208324 RepID=A0ABV0ZYV1_9TELE